MLKSIHARIKRNTLFSEMNVEALPDQKFRAPRARPIVNMDIVFLHNTHKHMRNVDIRQDKNMAKPACVIFTEWMRSSSVSKTEDTYPSL